MAAYGLCKKNLALQQLGVYHENNSIPFIQCQHVTISYYYKSYQL